MINLGEFNELEVVRKSDLGYMLTDGRDEILMHYKQSLRELEVGERVNVFIYADKEKRLTGSMQEPFATLEKPGFCRVVDIMDNIGVFVNINTPKDVLISKDYLPYNTELWPSVDDVLYIKLKVKANTLVAKPMNRYEILDVNNKISYEQFQNVDGYVYHISEKGISVITNDIVSIFIPTSQVRGTYHMGQGVTVTITKVLKDGCYGTLNPHKEVLMDTDKELILDYLKQNGGKMNLTAKSSAVEIENALKISRKAFKRAYGGLYKDGKIEFDENSTKLL